MLSIDNTFTYKQITEVHNICDVTLKKIVSRMKIKGKNLSSGSTKHFTISQVEDILMFKKKPVIRYDRRNIKIVEYYQKDMSAISIIRHLKISERIAYSVIKEYNNTGIVTVESKMNYS